FELPLIQLDDSIDRSRDNTASTPKMPRVAFIPNVNTFSLTDFEIGPFPNRRYGFLFPSGSAVRLFLRCRGLRYDRKAEQDNHYLGTTTKPVVCVHGISSVMFHGLP